VLFQGFLEAAHIGAVLVPAQEVTVACVLPALLYSREDEVVIHSWEEVVPQLGLVC